MGGALGVYALAPLVGWLAAGSLKFLVNSLRRRALAWSEIGYGGLPSTHSSIVSTTACLVGLREGWNSPAFSIAATLAFIVMLDAGSLRRQIGAHARALNSLLADDPARAPFRERMGHAGVEILAGVAVGLACAVALSALVGS
jgi:acid phosphatase family membrane protein YuiD